MRLKCDYSECAEDGGNKDEDNADWCNIFDNRRENPLPLEFSVELDLFDNCLRLDDVANKYAGEECNYRHNNAVACKIKYSENIKICNFNMTPQAVS